MKLTILGSNSSGNGYVIQNENEALILECGFRYSEVQKAVDFNTQKIVAALVSHEHGDHAKFVKEYVQRGVSVYASEGTLKALKLDSKNTMKHTQTMRIGSFTILPFNVKHDCAEPLGFFIHHPEMGNLVFATDTYYLPYKFEDVQHWLIECNYRKDILDKNCPKGSFKKVLRDRTLESHMSYETCEKALLANDLRPAKNIILIHLSDGNSNAFEFKRDIERSTGKMTYIADKNMEINLSKIGI